MLFQALVFNVVNLIFYAILYLIAVLLTRWLSKIQEYDDRWVPSLILNAIWFAVVLGTWLVMYLIFSFDFLIQINFIIALPANIILGIIIVYNENLFDIDDYKDCLKFVLLNLFLLFVILLVAFFVSLFVFASLA